jgi:hypothetical protein
VVSREGSILGDVVRQAFDYTPLRHHTMRDGKAIAVDHHIAVVGSITPPELRALVDDLSIVNGFLNRFLLIWSQQVDVLPFGAELPRQRVGKLAERIRANVEQARRLKPARPWGPAGPAVRFPFTDEASDRWEAFYAERRTGYGRSDLLRALNARHVAHAARVSLIYAAVGGARQIGLEHLQAAIAWCDYSALTADHIFGDSADTVDGRVLGLVRSSMPEGIARGELHRRLPHSWKAGWVSEAVEDFVAQRLIWAVRQPSTGGRPADVLVALAPLAGEGSKGEKSSDRGTSVPNFPPSEGDERAEEEPDPPPPPMDEPPLRPPDRLP